MFLTPSAAYRDKRWVSKNLVFSSPQISRQALGKSFVISWSFGLPLPPWESILGFLSNTVTPKVYTKKKGGGGRVKFWPTREPHPPTPLISNHTNITTYLLSPLAGRTSLFLISFLSFHTKTKTNTLIYPFSHSHRCITPPSPPSFSGKITAKLSRNL